MIGKNIGGYEILEFRGKGSFGTVYKCQKNNCIYAMKVFARDYVLAEFEKGNDNRITREIHALKSVDNKYVTKYVDDGVFPFAVWLCDCCDGHPVHGAL